MEGGRAERAVRGREKEGGGRRGGWEKGGRRGRERVSLTVSTKVYSTTTRLAAKNLHQPSAVHTPNFLTSENPRQKRCQLRPLQRDYKYIHRYIYTLYTLVLQRSYELEHTLKR